MKPEFDKNKAGTPGNAFNKDRTQNAPLGGGKQQHEGTRPMGNVTQKNQPGQPGGIDRNNLGNLGRKDKTDKR